MGRYWTVSWLTSLAAHAVAVAACGSAVWSWRPAARASPGRAAIELRASWSPESDAAEITSRIEWSAADARLDAIEPQESAPRRRPLTVSSELAVSSPPADAATVAEAGPAARRVNSAREVVARSAASAPEIGAAPRPVPSPRYNPSPTYPPEALAQGRSGQVLLRVWIDRQGRVAEMKLRRSSGWKVLDESARSAVARWRFDPADPSDPDRRPLDVPVDFVIRP